MESLEEDTGSAAIVVALALLAAALCALAFFGGLFAAGAVLSLAVLGFLMGYRFL